MALQFDQYLFFHIPRCGGNYVRRLLKLFYTTVEPNEFVEHGYVHCHPLSINLEITQNLHSFCVVRDPLSWYKSFFTYRMSKGWDHKHHIDFQCQSTQFYSFVSKMLKHFPHGWYLQFTSIVAPYVDRIVPLSALTDYCYDILLQKCIDLKLPKNKIPTFIEAINYNRANIEIDDSLPSKILDMLIEREVMPFRRMIQKYFSKMAYPTKAVKEFKI